MLFDEARPVVFHMIGIQLGNQQPHFMDLIIMIEFVAFIHLLYRCEHSRATRRLARQQSGIRRTADHETIIGLLLRLLIRENAFQIFQSYYNPFRFILWRCCGKRCDADMKLVAGIA